MEATKQYVYCLFSVVFTQVLIQLNFLRMAQLRRQIEWQTTVEMAETQYQEHISCLIDSHSRGRRIWTLMLLLCEIEETKVKDASEFVRDLSLHSAT